MRNMLAEIVQTADTPYEIVAANPTLSLVILSERLQPSVLT